jgi:hypothetical protein
MQGLMLKLLNVDADGERALRVVSYFDQLLIHQPTLDSVVRASAIIADCPVGLALPRLGLRIVFGPDGFEMPATAALSGTAIRMEIDGHNESEGGSVWLDRHDIRGDLDDFILERMEITVISVLIRSAPTIDADLAAGLADPALAQLLVNEKANEAERSRAARLMGIDPSSHVQLIAVQGDFSAPALVERLAGTLREGWRRPVFAAQLSREVVIVVTSGQPPVSWSAVALEHRAASSGVVEVLAAPTAWSHARNALRFAGLSSSWPRQLEATQVGVLGALAGLDSSATRDDPDVRRIEELAASPSGAESIRILDIVLHSDTLRSAARDANFHHSSIQSRLATIERRFGLSIKSGMDRQRVAAALLLWQLRSGG